MRIAIIGTGISGSLVARLLSTEHHVTVFEANDYPGGHTNTVDVVLDERQFPVDTGFMVFNRRTYPNFCRLLQLQDRPQWRTIVRGSRNYMQALLEPIRERVRLGCRTFDASIEEIVGIVADGARCIMQCDDRSWLAIGGLKRGRMLVLRPDHENRSTWQTRTEIRETLNMLYPKGSLSCVVVEPGSMVAKSDDAKSLKPWQRLWTLLKRSGPTFGS